VFAHLQDQPLLHKFNTTGLWQGGPNLAKGNICIEQKRKWMKKTCNYVLDQVKLPFASAPNHQHLRISLQMGGV